MEAGIAQLYPYSPRGFAPAPCLAERFLYIVGGCMRTAFRWLTAVACLCQAGPLLGATAAGATATAGAAPPTSLARPAISPAPAAPVRLVSPAREEALVGGTQATLAWEPLAPLDHLGPVEEWEAFLSLDGGRHYTVRITPHLSRALHRVLWSVPAAPSADVRILLRFGDERRERTWTATQRFRIVAAPDGGGQFLPEAHAIVPGEAPLPGEPGVVSWAEGTRQGAARRQVTYGAPATLSGLDLPVLAHGAGMAATKTVTTSPAPARRQRTAAEPATPATAADPQAAPPPPVDLLLMAQRRNE
jgi:hypothetical protein